MTPATVPMIAPNGVTGDIPQDKAQAAIAAGFRQAVVMTAPDGKTTGYIPQERAADAVKAGFKAGQVISPDAAGMQPKDSGFYGDLKNMVTGAPEAIARMTPGPQQYYQIKDAMADYESIKKTGKTRAQLADDARKEAGYGKAYRMIAPVGEQLGVNAQGMEQSAKEGDMLGVGGHAAAATVPVAASVIGGEMVRTPEGAAAAGKVADVTSAAVDSAKTGAAKTANFFAEIAPKTGKVIGKTAGGYVGSHFGTGGVIVGADVGSGLGTAVGVKSAQILGKLRDTLNKSIPEAAPNPTTSAESNFAEAGSREPEVVHEDDPVAAAPAKVKAILDKAEADIKQVTATKEQQPAAPGSKEDKLDDRALTQEMGWDIAKQYYKGLAEQRDMAASSLSSKTELTTGAKVDAILNKAAADARSVLEAAKIPSEGSKATIAGKIPASWVKDGKISVPKLGDDLVELLQRSLDQVKARKGKGTVVKPPKGSVDGESGAK